LLQARQVGPGEQQRDDAEAKVATERKHRRRVVRQHQGNDEDQSPQHAGAKGAGDTSDEGGGWQ
jgi:hypothetical protein